MDKEFEALATFNYIATRCQEEDSYIIKFPLGIEKGRTFAYEMEKAHEVMKQALIERQDLEKFTRLVVEKNVDILTLNSWFSKGIGDLKTYNYDLEDKDKLTEEEFDFIKEMIAKYGKSI